ncbi:MAG: protein translocase subunit SecF [Chloroflexi bacterium]|nr:protein translocase subunit SecF [Chloroflexota bacterium]
MWDLVGKRYTFFLLSAWVVVPGLLSLTLFGLPLSIDFTGGSFLELSFVQGSSIPPAEIVEIFAVQGLTDTKVQTSGEGTLLIRSKVIDPSIKQQLGETLRQRFGEFSELRFESVGPTVSSEVQRQAVLAVAAASLGILLYISWAFRHVPNPLRYGTCAILAVLHDAGVVVGLASIFGLIFGWEVDALFLTALLTIIGFSVHDSIVVFDRIRENIRRRPEETLESVVNHSIIQTLDRSINTSLTVVLTLFALILFGGVTIRYFVLVLLIGIVSGTYSSIFNASLLLVEWERRPQRLLYALSFLLPPLGAVAGLVQALRQEGSRIVARNALAAAGVGVVTWAALFALRSVMA